MKIREVRPKRRIIMAPSMRCSRKGEFYLNHLAVKALGLSAEDGIIVSEDEDSERAFYVSKNGSGTTLYPPKIDRAKGLVFCDVPLARHMFAVHRPKETSLRFRIDPIPTIIDGATYHKLNKYK